MTWGKPEFLLAEHVDSSPMVWFIEVNGMTLDARHLPLEIQVEAYLMGIIPYVPDLGTRRYGRHHGGRAVRDAGVATVSPDIASSFLPVYERSAPNAASSLAMTNTYAGDVSRSPISRNQRQRCQGAGIPRSATDL